MKWKSQTETTISNIITTDKLVYQLVEFNSTLLPANISTIIISENKKSQKRGFVFKKIGGKTELEGLSYREMRGERVWERKSEQDRGGELKQERENEISADRYLKMAVSSWVDHWLLEASFNKKRSPSLQVCNQSTWKVTIETVQFITEMSKYCERCTVL